MAVDHIRYDLLAQDALREMVRKVLIEVAKSGLKGEHHFNITFATGSPGVRIPERLREQYPQEMTIVLQYQFWDFRVGADTFEVGLSFGGVPERLTVPFAAITSFVDPSVQFGLQFETLTDEEAAGAESTAKNRAEDSPKDTPKDTPGKPTERPSAKVRTPGRQRPARTSVPASPPSTPGNPSPPASAGSPDQPRESIHQKPGDKPGAEVVRLDRFRKK